MYRERYKSHHDAYRAVKERFQETTIDKKEYVDQLLNSEAKGRRVLYLHVPFCTKVCSFCPFHRPDELKRREYDIYLLEEIDRIAGFRYMQAPIDAINFGGGTPTALSPRQMERILTKLHSAFSIREGAEISVETSITELSGEMTEVLKNGGVNRLSVGVQTFDDAGRKLLGRRGDGETAKERLKNVREAGFTNLNIDLIYNWPGETLEALQKDIAIIKELQLAGISFYSLMLHEKTPLYEKISKSDKERMEKIEWDKMQFDLILQELGKAGYQPFELTKIIRDDLDRYDYIRIRHSGGSCIAVGHGAGGNLDRYSYHNLSQAPLLDKSVPVSAMGAVLGEVYFVLDEFINDLQKMAVDLDSYSERLKFDLYRKIQDILERLEKEGLIHISGHSVTLTEDGIFWGNNVIDELLRRIIEK